ncbi:MAG: PAS domain S-box protein [Desulfococcaceae bacterium]|jgi:PAS domain S-box-containing protein|nr:PAS domain S-box protein [Desulfococcaceae bacterium]
MFDAATVINIFCLYMVLLFCVARLGENKTVRGTSLTDNPLVYSLSLGVYCTSWTFYGSVGNAAASGMSFLTIPIGPTVAFVLSGLILRRLVRIKNQYRITSIADFISARYDKSGTLAALVTVICLIAIAPYIALQLRAVISTFAIITDSRGLSASWIASFVGPILVTLMILFTNLFGVRRIDPTERHAGLMLAVALESLVKLVAFLAAGIFVTFYIGDGFGNAFDTLPLTDRPHAGGRAGMEAADYIRWCSSLLLSMSAVFFLPRQFHVAVVENFHEKHIRTAMWLFPLYLVLISIFAYPIAVTGLSLGFSPEKADTFPLFLPVVYRQKWLSLFVFIGGFSAATSMIMVSSVTLSTMMTNHLLFPVVSRSRRLGFLRPHLLGCRWVTVAFIICTGYGFERILGESYMLVSIGLISFAAFLQFAPVVLGGLFWSKGSKGGALVGLSAGFLIWAYTCLLPALAKSGWLSADFPETGLWGLAFLRPEHLFGLSALDPLSHTVFWSLFCNISFYIAGSLLFRQSAQEKELAEAFTGIRNGETQPRIRRTAAAARIPLDKKILICTRILQEYFPADTVGRLLEQSLRKTGMIHKKRISVDELARLHGEVEKGLAGAVGSATAHAVMQKGALFTPAEAEELSAFYGDILARMKITPEELQKKIAYYEEKETLLKQHAAELEKTVREREEEIIRRKKTEAELRKSETQYRDLFESAPDGILITSPGGDILSFNRAFLRMFRFDDSMDPYSLNVCRLYANPEQDRPKMLKSLYQQTYISNYSLFFRDRRGRQFPVSISFRLIPYGEATCILSIIRDVSEIRKMENKLKRYTENLELMVQEKTKELTAANRELSEVIRSLEETRAQLAVSAHRAGMAEMAVSVLHNIGNAVNSVNVRICGMDTHIPQKEVLSLGKIYEQFRLTEITDNMSASPQERRERLLSFFSITIDILKEKNRMFGEDLVFLRKGLDHIMEIIAIQQKYAGLRGCETAVNLNDIIRDAEEMLSDSIVRRGIHTERELGSLPLLFLDRNKMIQNFINILKNAYEAIDMAPENEKKIRIVTESVKRAEEKYIRIVIEDSGIGLSKETLAKVFRFNFSTKGRATGFGLHDTANYIRARGGMIDILSEGPGKGAQVIIRFPLSGENMSGGNVQ